MSTSMLHSEYVLGIIGTVGLAVVLIYSLLWWIGGRENLFWRRWIAPFVLTIPLMSMAGALGTFQWTYLFAIPAYWGVARLGYGGDDFFEKLLRRTMWSVIYCLPALIFVVSSGQWLVWGIQLWISVVMSLFFGIRNPVPASQEEGLICFGSTFLVPFML